MTLVQGLISRHSPAIWFLYLLSLLALTNAGSAQDSTERAGMPYDWSHHYLIFSRSTSPEITALAHEDLRYWQQQVRMARPVPADMSGNGRRPTGRVDWSVSLGGASSTIAAGMFPAKYSFNVNAPPDCTNDFVVYALNVTGSASQATIVAYNNLYSDPAGGGYCPGTGPAVKWAYNTGGAISTSPVMSVTGTRVAWVSNTNPPVFHVLTIGTSGNNGTSVTAPAVAGTGNNAVDTAISYGSIGDTRSSPFVDYKNDAAYVASDDGVMHKFSGVFRGTPAEVSSGGWPLHIINSSNHKIAGPVFDSVSKNLFYTDDNGNFTYIREVGSTQGICIGQPAPPCWGQSTYSLTSNGSNLVESPIVDSALQKVYVFVGNDNQGFPGHAHVLQTDTQLSSSAPEPLAGEGGPNMFAGAFDHNYYSNPSSGFLYVCGYPASAAGTPVLYRFGFDAAGKLKNPHDANSLPLGNPATIARCSPMTEFYNTTTATDWLFAGVEAGCQLTGSPCVMSFKITNTFPSSVFQARSEAGGTSGIIIDNVSSKPDASNIYFSTLSTTTCGDGTSGGGCAVKLTQAGLN